MNTLAIMQPYLFPYIGYFQLINAVDKFIFYDDVNFIKQGWINRNRILLNNSDFTFTVPLEKANSFTLIKDTLINERFYDHWRIKFQKTIKQNYKKAPHYSAVNELVNTVLNNDSITISELAIESVIATSRYLGLKTKFAVASECYKNKDLDRESRLVDICKEEGSTHYINPLGGKELYDKKNFAEKEIQLSFIETLPCNYQQFNNDFLPWLSIIDVLMFNSVDDVKNMLLNYQLL